MLRFFCEQNHLDSMLKKKTRECIQGVCDITGLVKKGDRFKEKSSFKFSFENASF